MQTKVFASTVLLALAVGTEAARHKPYMVARAPPMSLFGLMRRDSDGYSPETELCGDGNTCEEACGSGYKQCASNDSNNHCFNPAVGDTCCGVNSGDSCEKGFYCAHDTKSNTICCPADLDLEACAAALSPNDALTSDFPAASTTKSTAAPTTTKTTAAPAETTTAAEVKKPVVTKSAAVTVSEPQVVVSSSTYLVVETSTSAGSVPTDTPNKPAETTTGGASGPTPVPGEGAASGIKATFGLAAAAFIVALF